MEFSAKQIADFLKGEVDGDPDRTVNNFSKIEEGKKGTITFLANPKYSHFIYETKASIALVNADFAAERALPPTLTLVRVKNAYESLATLLQLVSSSRPKKKGIHPLSFISGSALLKDKENLYIGAFAYIGENVEIGKGVSIYPHVYIGDNAKVGDGTILYAGVRIYEGCHIGCNCILHSGAVIGADGFGFAPEPDGSFKKIPQMGNVVIEDDVEVGANTTIDRAVMDSTLVHKGVKLDNLIQIAHNVEIGENTGMAAQVGVSGSTKIGRNCMIGGQVGLGGHIHIGDRVGIGAQSGTISNIEDGRKILGSPAIDVKNFFKSSVIFGKLPEMYKELAALKKEVEMLKKEKER